MLRNVKDLRGYALRATDGAIGRVEDFYFDDEDWGIRYLVVNTGSWLSDRRVLISPIGGHRVLVSPDCIRDVSWSEAKVSVDLTRQAVGDLPLYGSIAQLQSTS